MSPTTRTATPSPVPVPTFVDVRPGPALLHGIEHGPGLAAHRNQYGTPPPLALESLVAMLEGVRLRGRGGAAFPFAKKLTAAVEGRRPHVVVNLSEGEPGSAKDSALATTRPHLILDGALAVAETIGARHVHLVLPGERTLVRESMRRALAERSDRLRVHTVTAESRFVAGQSSAVVERMAGRASLPVTSLTPTAVKGHRGRPTLLSNAETWAQIGLLVLRGYDSYRALGTTAEPGTTLLTLASTTGPPAVIEVEYGVSISDCLPERNRGRPLLVGGFHGSWAHQSTVASAAVSVDELSALGVPLGAGVLLSPDLRECPVSLTTRIVSYLADQSAGRCGPCFNGLPALAKSLRALSHGVGRSERLHELTRVIDRRGACAHPDGTVRLVRSLLVTFPDDVANHVAGRGHPCPAGVSP